MQELRDTKRRQEISLRELVQKFRQYYSYVVSKWVIILLFGIAGGVLGYLYADFKEPVYTAATSFVLEEGDKTGGFGGQYSGLASMIGIDLGGTGGGIFQGDNILELYKSRTMIEKTLLTEIDNNGKKELLVETYIDFNSLRKKWLKKRPDLLKIKFNDRSKFGRVEDSIIGVIVRDINKKYLLVSKPDKKLNIITAQVRSTNEFFAKVFNDQIVKNVNDFYIQTKTKKSLENVIILQQKTDSVRNVMNGAIYLGASIADATPNLNPTRQVQRVVPMQRSQFNAETNKAILAQLVQNLELSKISLHKETPLIQVIDKPVFPLEVEQLGKLKSAVIGIILLGFLTVAFFVSKLLVKSIDL